MDIESDGHDGHHRDQQQPQVPRSYPLVEKLFICLVGVFALEVIAAATFYCIIFFAFSHSQQSDLVAVVAGTTLAATIVILVPIVAIARRSATIVYVFVTLVLIVCVLLFLDFVTRSSSLPRHVDDCLFFVQYFGMAAVGFLVAKQYQSPPIASTIPLDLVIERINNVGHTSGDDDCESRSSNDVDHDGADGAADDQDDQLDNNQLDARSVSELIVK